jgi:hypothetical protein
MLGAMSDQRGGGPTSAGGVQFDQAEYAVPGAERACALCGSPITEQYFEAEGNVVCPACVERHYGEKTSAAALTRAFGYGVGAALAGSLAWYVMVRLTGWQLGFVAIGVGLLVGYAVHKGGSERGGWKYQVMAIALTYASIASANVPVVLNELAAAAERDGATTAATEAAAERAASKPESPLPDIPIGPSIARQRVEFGILLVLAASFAAPFLDGNLIGILIIGFALYEAWKINRRVPIRGPFQIGVAAPPAAPAPA